MTEEARDATPAVMSPAADTVEETPPATVYDVAWHILQKFDGGISTMKLQRLLYLAQGWNLAILGRPLFAEQFEAWPSGPVNREIYELLKGEYTVTTQIFGDRIIQLARSRSTAAPSA